MYFSRIPNGTDLQRELGAFILLPEDQGNRQYGFSPFDLWVMVCVRNVESSYQSHQERLHLEDAIQ